MKTCRIFALEVFSLLLRKQLINQNLVQKILQWRHTGFNVHSIDPLICTKCGGTMRIVSLVEDHKVICRCLAKGLFIDEKMVRQFCLTD